MCAGGCWFNVPDDALIWASSLVTIIFLVLVYVFCEYKTQIPVLGGFLLLWRTSGFFSKT